MGAIGAPEPRTEEMSGYLIKRAQAGIHVRLEEIVSAHGLSHPPICRPVVPGRNARACANADLARRAFVTPPIHERGAQAAFRGRLDLVERRSNPTNARILNARTLDPYWRQETECGG